MGERDHHHLIMFMRRVTRPFDRDGRVQPAAPRLELRQPLLGGPRAVGREIARDARIREDRRDVRAHRGRQQRPDHEHPRIVAAAR